MGHQQEKVLEQGEVESSLEHPHQDRMAQPHLSRVEQHRNPVLYIRFRDRGVSYSCVCDFYVCYSPVCCSAHVVAVITYSM